MTTAQPDFSDIASSMEPTTPQPSSSGRDVDPRQYPAVIREMIRHENDVTNHRIMWLLIVQGLIVNAYVAARLHDSDDVPVLALGGILVTLSTFVLLYKSYHARGYLMFLGQRAKHGALAEQHVPLVGWPKARIAGWRSDWLCPWLDRVGDLLEPYFFLPGLLNLLWVFELLRRRLTLSPLALFGLAVPIVLLIVAAVCVAWLWLQGTDAPRKHRAA